MFKKLGKKKKKQMTTFDKDKLKNEEQSFPAFLNKGVNIYYNKKIQGELLSILKKFINNSDIWLKR